MTETEFHTACEFLEKLGSTIEADKRPAYTHGDSDVLKNFKEGAAVTNTSTLQYWAAHFHKHFSTVVTSGQNPSIHQSEPLHMRFADMRNYIRLGFALYCERVKQTTGGYPWETETNKTHKG